MDLEKKIIQYKYETMVTPQEADILDTIQKSKEAFYQQEQECMLTYLEFLWVQFRLVKKQWWALQLVFLIVTGMILSTVREDYYLQRSLGIAGVLFVVFAIPELWKNRSCSCMEIEASAYYSLSRIYAARILLFGIVDLCLLTGFCAMLLGTLHLSLLTLLSQFLFPMVVAACICFGMLCSNYAVSETVSVTLCLAWCAVWWLIALNEQIYSAVLLPVWLCLLGAAVILLAAAVYRTLHNCQQYWETALKETH